MRLESRTIVVLILTCGVGGSCLQARTSRAKKKAPSPTTAVRPLKVDLLALQVSKLPRDDFGNGIKPGTQENVAFWLANS